MPEKYNVRIREVCGDLARTKEKLESLREQLAELEHDNFDPDTAELVRDLFNALERRISNQENRLNSLTRLAKRFETV